jgi:hypothetical protein
MMTFIDSSFLRFFPFFSFLPFLKNYRWSLVWLKFATVLYSLPLDIQKEHTNRVFKFTILMLTQPPPERKYCKERKNSKEKEEKKWMLCNCFEHERFSLLKDSRCRCQPAMLRAAGKLVQSTLLLDYFLRYSLFALYILTRCIDHAELFFELLLALACYIYKHCKRHMNFIFV